MRLVLNERFNGADGDAWPTGHWSGSVSVGGGTFDQNTKRGRITLPNAAGGQSAGALARIKPLANLEVLAKFEVGTTNTSTAFALALRTSGDILSTQDPTTAFYVDWQLGGGGTHNVVTVVGGVTYTTLHTTAHTFALNDKVWCRVRLYGRQYAVKFWLDTANEPAAWSHTGAQDSVLAAGYIQPYFQGPATTAGLITYLHQLTVWELESPKWAFL